MAKRDYYEILGVSKNASDDEIKKMLKATEIAHKSLLELDVRSKQEKGVEEWECAYELGYLMRKNGASVESFDTIFAPKK